VFGRPSPKAVDGRSSLRSSFFSTTRTRRPSLYTNSASIEDEYNDDRDDMMDLSLGQEHAGGGFGGKRAKLGKLIVEEEGLKMLDLVVTANMGIWWRVYEKASRE
ncbi:hypothetical protein MMC06_003941, partial [Schaereria dolodes]|nr:hypothetical protein [Schaereria dolodes]